MLLCFLSMTAAAFAQYNLYDGPHFRIVPPPGNGPLPPFRKVVTASLTRLGFPDAVIVLGDKPVLCVASGFYPTSLVYAISASDLAVLPAAGPGGSDAVIAASSSGLQLLGVNGKSLWSQPLDEPGWVGIDLLRTIDLDEDGALDLVGVTVDRLRVLTATRVNGHFVDGPSFSTTHAIDDVVGVDWSASGHRDLALLTSWGVEIYHLGEPDPFFAREAHQPGGTLTMFRQLGSERLAWVTAVDEQPVSVSGQQLVLLDQAAEHGNAEAPVLTGPVDAVACAATDIELDGKDELVVSGRYGWDPIVVLNQKDAGIPTFTNDPSGVIFVESGQEGAAVSDKSNMALRDLDGDGDPDLVYPMQDHGDLLVMLNEMRPGVAWAPHVNLVSVTAIETDDKGVYQVSAQLDVTLPASTTGATHIEAILWHQSKWDATVDVEAAQYKRTPVDPSEEMTIEFPLAETVPEFDAVYTAQLRMVEVGQGQQIVRYYPTTMVIFNTRLEVIQHFSPTPDPLQLNVFPPIYYGGPPKQTGGSVSTPTTPPFPYGSIPNPNGSH
jgi:hypothetical protein